MRLLPCTKGSLHIFLGLAVLLLSVSPLLPRAAYADPPNSVATYSFDEGTGTTAGDASGNGHPGTINGATWASGYYGFALSFDGTNDYVSVADNSQLRLGGVATVTGWVKTSNQTAMELISKGGSAWEMGVIIGWNNGSGNKEVLAAPFTCGGNEVGQAITNGQNVTDGNWHHIAVTMSGNETNIYIDGVLSASAPITSPPCPGGADPVRFGHSTYTGNRSDYSGLIDNVRIYNRPLTASEIATDMQTPVGVPQLVITQPVNGAVINGSQDGTTVDITYSITGVLETGDHAHLVLDGVTQMDIPPDGSYQWTGVAPGPHTLSGYVAHANHSRIDGSEAPPVDFTIVLPDSNPPSVSITAPAEDTIVSGSVQVSATASDDVGVAGVRFFADGNSIGSEDTTEPYGVLWNTATIVNGDHELTAQARDAWGNVTISAVVHVTANNRDTRSIIGSWAPPVSMPFVGVHVALLPTGKVMTWEGKTSDGAASLWDPATGVFESVPNTNTNLFCAGHAMIGDGKLMTIGGDNPGAGLGVPDSNQFDPTAETWTQRSNMSFNRWYPTATTLPNGKVLAMGGVNQSEDDTTDTPELYNVATNTWTPLTEATLRVGMYPYNFVLPDGNLFMAGSFHELSPSRTLDLTTQTWTTVDPTIMDGGSAVQYEPWKFMKAGHIATNEPDFTPSNPRTYVIDMSQPSPAWRETQPMNFERVYHVLTLLPDGATLVTGGGPTHNQLDDANAILNPEIWNPTTETWTVMAAGQRSRLYHGTALLLADGRVWVAGGGSNQGTNQLNYEIFSPPYLFKGDRPTVTAAPYVIEDAAPFFVETPDGATIEKVTLVRAGSMTHSFNPDQRFLNLSFTQTDGGLTVQAPADANVAPPGYYMLFLINADGVPSLAQFIRLPAAPEPFVPLSVSLTAPAEGATVSGTAPVSARVTGTVPVAGVLFQLDGVTIGEEDTTAPYSVSWMTTATTDGNHVLTAIARDTAENTATSAEVTVTVNNTAPPLSPIAAYALDENLGTIATDATGNGHNGNITRATWASGYYGSALSFDGNDYVEVADQPNLRPAHPSVTAWVKWDGNTSRDNHIVAKQMQTSGWQNSIALYIARSSSSLHAVVGASPDNVLWTQGNVTISPNVWHHVAMTYDGAVLKLYVDGVLADSMNGSVTIPYDSNPLWIGADENDADNVPNPDSFFSGSLDNVRMYDKALTPAEVVTDRDTPIGSSGSDTTPPTVSITSPTDGDTVTGTINVTADATDDVGVFGVQFRLDGAPLKAEDLTSPYAIAWNTAQAANGQHTITATARDAAGNTATSTDVTVTVSNTEPSLSPVAAYALDENTGTLAADATGNDHNGTINGATWAPGYYGSALSFDGTNDYVSVADNSQLRLRGVLTVTGWVKTSNQTAMEFIGKGGNTWESVVLIGWNSGSGNKEVLATPFTCGGNEVGQAITSGPNVNVTDGNWHHIAVTMSGPGGFTKIYIDGVLRASAPITGTPCAGGTDPVRIGHATYTANRSDYSGLIDNVRIYDRALTPEGVVTDMNTPINP